MTRRNLSACGAVPGIFCLCVVKECTYHVTFQHAEINTLYTLVASERDIGELYLVATLYSYARLPT